MTISGSIFKDNSVLSAIAVTGGGAIYTVSGAGQTIAYNNCTFDSNTVIDSPVTTPNSSGGGAISVGGGVSPTTSGSIFYNNSYNNITNALKSDIFVFGGGTFTASNSTLQPLQASFTSSYNVTTGNSFSNTTDPAVPASPSIVCPTAFSAACLACLLYTSDAADE